MNTKGILKACRLGALPVAVAIGLAAPAAADLSREAEGDRLYVGFLLHDRGPAADRHEDGFDINLEYQFAPPAWTAWQWIGAPRPHVGATISLNNETSTLYSGVTYGTDLLGKLFFAAHGGLAVHDGMMHQKDRQRCSALSDCGFGSRVLFRGGLELGIKVADNRSVSLLWDHVSHGKLLASENEGIDHIGVRYGIGF